MRTHSNLCPLCAWARTGQCPARRARPSFESPVAYEPASGPRRTGLIWAGLRVDMGQGTSPRDTGRAAVASRERCSGTQWPAPPARPTGRGPISSIRGSHKRAIVQCTTMHVALHVRMCSPKQPRQFPRQRSSAAGWGVAWSRNSLDRLPHQRTSISVRRAGGRGSAGTRAEKRPLPPPALSPLRNGTSLPGLPRQPEGRGPGTACWPRPGPLPTRDRRRAPAGRPGGLRRRVRTRPPPARHGLPAGLGPQASRGSGEGRA